MDTPGEDLAGISKRHRVHPAEGNLPDAVDVRIQGRNKRGILMPKPKTAAVALPPHPELPVHKQRRVEETAGDAARDRAGGIDGSGKASGGRGEDKVGGEAEVGDRGGVVPDLLHPAAKLAGAAPTPREEVDGGAGAIVGRRPEERRGGGGGWEAVEVWGPKVAVGHVGPSKCAGHGMASLVSELYTPF